MSELISWQGTMSMSWESDQVLQPKDTLERAGNISVKDFDFFAAVVVLPSPLPFPSQLQLSPPLPPRPKQCLRQVDEPGFVSRRQAQVLLLPASHTGHHASQNSQWIANPIVILAVISNAIAAAISMANAAHVVRHLSCPCQANVIMLCYIIHKTDSRLPVPIVIAICHCHCHSNTIALPLQLTCMSRCCQSRWQCQADLPKLVDLCAPDHL